MTNIPIVKRSIVVDFRKDDVMTVLAANMITDVQFVINLVMVLTFAGRGKTETIMIIMVVIMTYHFFSSDKEKDKERHCSLRRFHQGSPKRDKDQK